MSKTILQVMTAVLLGHISLCVNWTATVTCVACSISCRYSNCYRITGNGYDEQVCGTNDCTMTKALTPTFGNCTYDLYGNNCPTAVCLYMPVSKGCASTYFPSQTCTNTAYNYEISCGACNSNTVSPSTCGNCRIEGVQGSNTQTQTCLGTTCKDVQFVRISVATCTGNVDVDGNACSCCYSVTNTLASTMATCSNYYFIYSDANFNRFLKIKTNWQGTLAVLAVTVLLAFAF